ncbi:MAG: hypothetical protein AAGD35_03900 [Actinomycetota bacterium]
MQRRDGVHRLDNAFALTNPDAARFIEKGLEPTPGRRLVFGDRTLLNE